VVEYIIKYFPYLSELQIENFSRLKKIYEDWNTRINVISRKDIDNFFVHHVLHSLAIAKIIKFNRGTKILDVGTGGGFPGIPLAIIFPDSAFSLLDSIGKKIKVVSSVASELKLTNVKVILKRAEEENGKYDFVVSRAVKQLPGFVALTRKNIEKESTNKLKNGIIYLKGGDITEEINSLKNKVVVWEIKDLINEPYFETKKIVYIPL
jgi:16S rRNA (guanine527-N7)-methyltransferase